MCKYIKNNFCSYIKLVLLAGAIVFMIELWECIDSLKYLKYFLFTLLSPVFVLLVYGAIRSNYKERSNSESIDAEIAKNKFRSMEITGLIVIISFSIITVHLVREEQKMANKFKRLEHYNVFNKRYSDWYSKMPDCLSNKKDYDSAKSACKFDLLTLKEKAWIRTYFNIYTQEYYLYKEKMIPEAMWYKVIHGEKGNCNTGAMINLKLYPILVEGYTKWKKEGAFTFPEDFKRELDAKLNECGLL